jgi:hypothetical protein
MPEKKASDFRYNTGESKVPWAAVGENYNVDDISTWSGFSFKKRTPAYDEVFSRVASDIAELSAFGRARESSRSEKTSAPSRRRSAHTSTRSTRSSSRTRQPVLRSVSGTRISHPGRGDRSAITFCATQSYALGLGA